MPIYEYRCSKCGDFEVTQRMSDKSLAQCPTCRRRVTKLISQGSFQLKGSGWYVTDYARKQDGSDKSEKRGDEKKGDEKKGEAKEAKEGKAAPSSGASETTAGSEKKAESETKAGSEKKAGGKKAAAA